MVYSQLTQRRSFRHNTLYGPHIMKNLIAFFAGVLAIVMVAKAMGATLPAHERTGTRWHAVAFIYVNNKYVHVIDLLADPYTNIADCLEASKAALSGAAAAHAIPDDTYIVGACIETPDFTPKSA